MKNSISLSKTIENKKEIRCQIEAEKNKISNQKFDLYDKMNLTQLIAEMIESYKGEIYELACRSGGMFVWSIKFIEAHHGNTKDVSIYGQDYTNTTF